MVVPKLDRQHVLGALRATGSSDPAILYAKKEELLSESRRMKLLGIVPYFVGGAMCLTLVGAIVGIPIIWFGYAVGKTIRANVAVADETLAEYQRSLQSA